jgi:hypothetical protein
MVADPLAAALGSLAGRVEQLDREIKRLARLVESP